MDVLYLSISMGAGHIRAAEALNEYIEKKYPGSRTLIVDTFKYINTAAHKLIVDGYLNIVEKRPELYGWLYGMSEYKGNINTLSEIVSRLLSYKIKRLISGFKPSIIVCTHPFPLQMISFLKKKEKLDIPVIAILTDYVNHPLWFHDNIEAYIVGHDTIKKDMIKYGFLKERIFSYGIPVSPCFLDKKNKKDIRMELGLEDRFTLLVMGGSLGFGEIEHTFLYLSKNLNKAQFIVVTGKNDTLKKRLEQFSSSFGRYVRILGYTDNIPILMDASDLIITKPGGMTVSEALVKELPMAVISPIPGQEERNAEFLVKSGAAIRIPSKDQDGNLLEIINNPAKLAALKKKSSELAKPLAGQNIAKLMGNMTSTGTNQITSVSP